MDDKKLINKLRQKNEKSLILLTEKYGAYVSTVVRNVADKVIPESDIEEISADVFIRLWNNSEKIDPSTLRSYLAVIARNLTIDRLRKLHYTLPYEEIELSDDIVEDSINIENVVERRIIDEELKAALDEIKPRSKELLLRFYFYYQKISKIAQQMGMSESACKTALLRARKELKAKLIEKGYIDEI